MPSPARTAREEARRQLPSRCGPPARGRCVEHRTLWFLKISLPLARAGGPCHSTFHDGISVDGGCAELTGLPFCIELGGCVDCMLSGRPGAASMFASPLRLRTYATI